MSTSADVLNAYLEQGPLTDPGPYAHPLSALPDDLHGLHEAVNGLLIHVWKVRKYHPEWLEARPHAVFVRRVRHLLEGVLELDPAPLNEPRPEARRLVVDCRSFAVLLCAALRHQGVPARARCGFATYLEPTHFQDHWVCEVWNHAEGRWQLEDPDLIKHDLGRDLGSDAFITGAQAWTLVRCGEVEAARFGFSADACGEFAVRINAVHDVAALCGFESVSGDAWGLALGFGEPSQADLEVLDQAADLASSDVTLTALRRYVEACSSLKVPEVLEHYDYLKEASQRVAWREVP